MASDREVVFNELRQRKAASLRNLAAMRANGGGATPLIIPEGTDDVSLIEKAFEGRADIRLLEGGKVSSLLLAEMLEADGIGGVCILVDRDLDSVTPVEPRNFSTVVFTEAHDTLMDVLVAAPRVLKDSIRRVNRNRYRPLTSEAALEDIENIIARAVEAVFNLTLIRVISARRELGLNFRKFPFARYLEADKPTLHDATRWVLLKARDEPNLGVDTEELTVSIAGRKVALFAEASAVHSELYADRWKLVGDHDFLAVLDFWLEGNWGSSRFRDLLEAEVTREEILSSPWGIKVERFLNVNSGLTNPA